MSDLSFHLRVLRCMSSSVRPWQVSVSFHAGLRVFLRVFVRSLLDCQKQGRSGQRNGNIPGQRTSKQDLAYLRCVLLYLSEYLHGAASHQKVLSQLRPSLFSTTTQYTHTCTFTTTFHQYQFQDSPVLIAPDCVNSNHKVSVLSQQKGLSANQKNLKSPAFLLYFIAQVIKVIHL